MPQQVQAMVAGLESSYE